MEPIRKWKKTYKDLTTIRREIVTADAFVWWANFYIVGG